MSVVFKEFDTEAAAELAAFDHPGSRVLKPRGSVGKFKLRIVDPAVAAVEALTQTLQTVHAIDEHQKAQRAPQGTYRKLASLLADRTVVEWLIRDFIEQGVIALMAGPRGSYKSALANLIAVQSALAGFVVFVLSPEGSGLQRRFQALLDKLAPGKDASTLPLYVRDRRLNLSVLEERAALGAWLDEIEKETGKPVSLCVFDTWNKVTGHNEDSNSETKLELANIDRLRRRAGKPATCLIVHHTGHNNQDRARGASALSADTDAEYIVSLKADTVTVTRSRFKDSPSLPPLYFKPEVRQLSYTDDTGNAVTSVVLVPTDKPGTPAKDLTEKQQELLDHALSVIQRGNGPQSADVILAGIEGRGPDLRRRLQALNGRGLFFDGKLYSVQAPIIQDSGGWLDGPEA